MTTITKLKAALDALEWYVKEDDVIENMDGNEFWVDAKRTAEKSITDLRSVIAEMEAGEPYGWHYWNNGGASVLHRGPSKRLDADMAVADQYPNVHHCVALFAHAQPKAEP